MATATDSIVLEEEIDPNYDPSEDEILEYAKWLGFDLEGDKDLLYIAKEGAATLHFIAPLGCDRRSLPHLDRSNC